MYTYVTRKTYKTCLRNLQAYQLLVTQEQKDRNQKVGTKQVLQMVSRTEKA